MCRCYGANITFLQQTRPSLSLFHYLHASTCHVSWLATLLLPLFSLVQSYQTHLYEHLLHHIHYVQINIHKNKKLLLKNAIMHVLERKIYYHISISLDLLFEKKNANPKHIKDNPTNLKYIFSRYMI